MDPRFGYEAIPNGFELQNYVETFFKGGEPIKDPEIAETKVFLEENLPMENPTHEDYVRAYQRIEDLRNTRDPLLQESNQLLALSIERGLPYLTRGYSLVQHQMLDEVMRDVRPEDSFISDIVFADFSLWREGYSGRRLWSQIQRQIPSERGRALNIVTDRIVQRLLLSSMEYSGMMTEAYEAELAEYKATEGKKKGKNFEIVEAFVPKKWRPGIKKLAENLWSTLPTHLQESEAIASDLYNSRIFFESMAKLISNPDNIFATFPDRYSFWISDAAEPFLLQLLVSSRSDFRAIYYRILEATRIRAEELRDIELVGSIGTRHALRLAGFDPREREFADLDFWRGINRPDGKKKRELPDMPHPNMVRNYKGMEQTGFEILGQLTKTQNPQDAEIYRTTMMAFIEYIKANKAKISDYDINIKFFQTQFTFDTLFNLPKLETDIRPEDTTFNFILRKYLWLKYGPEYTKDKPSPFDIQLWKLQRRILLSGINIFEDLMKIQELRGQDMYEVHRDFYQAARQDLQDFYYESGWSLIMYTTKNFDVVKNIFKDTFKKFRITVAGQDERYFYIAILLGTLDFAIDMKHRASLQKISNTATTYMHGTKIPTRYEESTQRAEEELQRWKFRRDKATGKVELDNNFLLALRNLSIWWGRGYGVTVSIEQGGLRVKNPLHTMGAEKETEKVVAGNKHTVKERPNKGGRDEVLIPWDIIAKATPQFDFVPWADSVLKLVGKFRANFSSKKLNWVSDIVSKGSAVVRFEASGSDRLYELPPVPNARELAKILKELADVMVLTDTPTPQDLLKKIE